MTEKSIGKALNTLLNAVTEMLSYSSALLDRTNVVLFEEAILGILDTTG